MKRKRLLIISGALLFLAAALLISELIYLCNFYMFARELGGFYLGFIIVLLLFPVAIVIYFVLGFFFFDSAKSDALHFNTHFDSMFFLPVDLATLTVLILILVYWNCWETIASMVVIGLSCILRVVLAVSFFTDLHRTRKAEKQREQDGQPARPEPTSDPTK